MRARIVTLCAAPTVLALLSAVPAYTESTSTRKAATTPDSRAETKFTEIDLVSDVAGKAAVTDPKLVNPWGLAMGKTLWVSDAGTGAATVYTGGSGTVKKAPTEVWIPGGTPTGQVFNNTEGFMVKGKMGSAPASFIFASPSGAISGWSDKADPKNAIISAFTRGADYKGLALMKTNRGTFLLAASFSHGQVHVWDDDFDRVPVSRGRFRDPRLPRNYSPFNVEIVGNSVFVAYAKRDPETGKQVAGKGNGFVSQFTPDGRYMRRFANRGALNAPWAMTLAPRGYGSYAGALLIGNFGDGWVNAYNPRNGRYLGPLRKADGTPIAIQGLWDLEPGTAENGGENALWFSAGIDKAQHGLLGLIRPAGAGDAVATPSASATPSATATATATPSFTPSASPSPSAAAAAPASGY